MGKLTNKLTPLKINHPNSRKAKQFIRLKKKEAARDRKKLSQFIKLNTLGEKILWFRDNLDNGVEEYTPAMVAELIEKYLNRFEHEVSIIQAVRPYEKSKYASRKDQIRHTIEDETQEYHGCGLEIPNILNKANLEILRKWNGELRYLQNLVMVRYKKHFEDSGNNSL